MAHTFPTIDMPLNDLWKVTWSADIAIEVDLHLEVARVSHPADGGRRLSVTAGQRTPLLMMHLIPTLLVFRANQVRSVATGGAGSGADIRLVAE